ncbi:hypothetical protein [Duncaniella muris]|uniref:hypothetical protein n=1 Tax=Duncaniella muris TaxID=2094150 RepID=UPI003F6622F0
MIRTLDNYNLTAHNTFAMNVKCSEFMEYTKADDIPFIISSIRKGVEKFPYRSGQQPAFHR